MEAVCGRPLRLHHPLEIARESIQVLDRRVILELEAQLVVELLVVGQIGRVVVLGAGCLVKDLREIECVVAALRMLVEL